MIGRARFSIYRDVIGLLQSVAFKKTKVLPLQPPAEGTVRFRPFAEAFPNMPIKGLYHPETFPAADQPEKRLRRIRSSHRLLSAVTRIAPRRTPPIPRDLDQLLAVVYPRGFRKAWPTPPRVPPELAKPGTDVFAELAVRAPFGSYLRRSETGEDAYVLDLDWMAGYQAKASLVRPGGVVRLGVRDGRLVTTSVEREGVAPDRARAAALAALNEDLTTFRHNLSVHLATLTSFALATTNHLDARHPVRRLLHHCFNTVVIGNHELATFHFSGPKGFAATIFSHDAGEVTRMADERLGSYDFWDFEPDTQFRNRGTTTTPFDYPYRDNMLRLWAETSAYTESYLGLYYDGDKAVRADTQLASWSRELDRLVPNGVSIPEGGPNCNWLTRICATLIHLSTVEHDVLNNIVWNYSTIGWIVPTVAPESGEEMDQRRAFDLIATLIVTWKPYNMLLSSDVASLALDEPAAAVMRRWIERLGEIQGDMASRPVDLSLSYPANFNVSISN